MNNKKNINRFDPFIPVNMSGLGKNKLSDAGNTDFSGDFVSDASLNFFAMDDKFRVEVPSVKKGFVVLLTKREIGSKNELGERLLTDFVFSLSEMVELPQYFIVMNEAVFLLSNDKFCEYVFKMQKYGVKFYVSAESMEFFGYNNTLKGMKQATSGDIMDKIIFSDKLINM